jgi:hypothetical protein
MHIYMYTVHIHIYIYIHINIHMHIYIYIHDTEIASSRADEQGLTDAGGNGGSSQFFQRERRP